MDKTIIFDCDGVLVDSEIIANRIDAEELTKKGYPLTTEESIRRFSGINATTVRKIILEETGLNISLEEFEKQEKLGLKVFEKELQPLIEPVLQFAQANNLNYCIASSSSKSKVIYSLKLTNQLKYFDTETIFTSEMVKNGKPAPDLFLYAAEQLKVAPKNCLVIEDSLAGVTAAQSAGMNAIVFLGGSHATFDWYRQLFSQFNIPKAYSSDELKTMLDKLLNFL
ncbi:MAG: hypothetical protein BGO10_05140 [Chlamydia sp. 32-24]|nr:MAG: hypothetical protein BGO10_05140 [Chlamydia sp. 32-24]